MRLSEQIEQDLLDLEPSERLEMLQQVSYFIQSLAALKKAENEKPVDEKEDYEELIKQAILIREVMSGNELSNTAKSNTQ